MTVTAIYATRAARVKWFAGLSSDTKPVPPAVEEAREAYFIELDTQKSFIWHINQWREFALFGGDPISALFSGGAAGGYYPIRPGVNLWQDTAKTVPAVNLGDPVRVVAKVAGTLGDLVSPSDTKRPVVASQDGKYMLQYDGVDDVLNITFTPISGWSLYFRAKGTGFLGDYEVLLSAEELGGNYVFWGQNTGSDTAAAIVIQTGGFITPSTNFLANNILGLRTFATVNTYDYRVNGSLIASSTCPSFTLTKQFFIGLKFDGAVPWKGYIGDTVFIDRNDAAAITTIEANL